MSDIKQKAEARLQEVRTERSTKVTERAMHSRKASELQKDITQLDGEERSLLSLLDETKD